MSGAYSRSRFYQLPRYDASLSSRFGDIPALMERETPSTPSSTFSHSTFNPHVVLPPIRYRKFGQNVNQNMFFPNSFRKPNQIINSMAHHNTLDNLLRKMPNINQLPQVPIATTPEEENAIIMETNYQLTDFDAVNLKDLYVTFANTDQELTGCTSYHDLLFTFKRKNVPITDQLLQLIAAQFVSRKEFKKVNYEKILSFLGAALKLNKTRSNDDHFALQTPRSENRVMQDRNNQRSPGKVVFYHDNTCPRDEESGNSYTGRDDPVILRLLENSVRHQFTPLNLESLRLAFQRSDRLLRGTLSERQIKELCYQHNVMIEDNILEKVIRRCKQRGGGQYDWQQFIRYLERVQPVQTGLNIRASKMPQDYIKYMPHPSSNWPQAESFREHEITSNNFPSQQMSTFNDYNDPEQLLPPPLPSNRSYGVQTLEVHNENSDPLLSRINQLQNEIRNFDNRSTTSEQLNSANEEKSQRLPYDDTDRTQIKRTDTTPQDNILTQSWFTRFMEMADRVYKIDLDCTGALPENRLLSIVEKYSDMLNLNLKEEDIRQSISASQRYNGSIGINSFLKHLAVQNQAN